VELTKQTKTQVLSILRKTGEWQGFLCPSRCFPNIGHPFNMAMACEFDQQSLVIEDVNGITEFSRTVDSFHYYNCTNETGLRVHYYGRSEEDDSQV
jgi:hypothetical protein